MYNIERARKIILSLDEAKELPLHELTYDLAMKYDHIENKLIEKPLATAFKLMYTEVNARYDGLDGSEVLRPKLNINQDQDRNYVIAAAADDDEYDDYDDGVANVNDHKNEESRSHGISEIKLIDCLMYLRQVHRYCLFCGTSYSNEIDLIQNCPGVEEDEH
jgi:hypothetical protein